MTARFPEMMERRPATFSFEFFPPKTEAAAGQLFERARAMTQLRPAFVSVTYGAGGSERDRTREVVGRFIRELGLSAAAHITCIGHTRAELVAILESYRRQGVHNLVALRGDAPPGTELTAAATDGPTYAIDLVRLIRTEFGDHFGIAVAGYPEGHPETVSRIADLEHLKAKVDAGADIVVTQLFFDNRDFYDFRERCEMNGIDAPIVAGIMPVLSNRGIRRMADLSGARLPAKLLRRLQRAGDDNEEVARVGIDWATQQCRDLLENRVRGIHFYTLNRSDATAEIYRRLGADDSTGLERLAGT